MLLVLALLQAAHAFQCTRDSDCDRSLSRGSHGLFCNEGKCTQLVSPGKMCTRPGECASYFYFGEMACSARCPSDECNVEKRPGAMFCCRDVPSGEECLPSRPGVLSGCAPRHRCVNGEDGPVCTPILRKKWALGPIFSICGNLLINVGLNVQKRSYAKETARFLGREFNLFYVGIGVYVAGKISGFSSYIFGDQSMLASLGAVGLIANSIFAPMINSEIFTVHDFFSICFVLTGSTLILLNSGRTHRTFSLCKLLRMYFRRGTILWFMFLLSTIGALLFVAFFIEANSDWSFDSALTRLLKSERTHFGKNGPVLRYVMVFVYVGLSATIASFTTLFAKSFGQMVELTLSGDNQFRHLSTYMFFILIFLCTCGQIYWLNRALKRYDALLVIPIFHVFWTLLSVATAGIYFQDFVLFDRMQFKGFVLGLFVIFIGSAFLGFRLFGRDTPTTEQIDLDVQTKSK
jgi:magnesium transporter